MILSSADFSPPMFAVCTLYNVVCTTRPVSQAVLSRGGRQRGRLHPDHGREARRGQPLGRQDRQGGGPLLQVDGGRRGAAQQ